MLMCIIFIVFIPVVTGHGDEGFFWHLTDIHYDPWYGNPLGISCNEDVPDAGEYGDYECDSPWALVKSAIEEMRNIDNMRSTEPDFILWSGDNPPHVYNKNNSDMVDNDVIIDVTRNITNLIMDAFPGKLVLPVLGNHDYYPKNQLPGEENDLYNAYYDMWSDWLNTTDMENTFKRGAYYSTLISQDPKVHVVVLNTNLYYHSNEATRGQDDPGGQIAWFENLMNNARQNEEKVYLFYHVPFGKVPEPVDGVKWLVSKFNSYFEQAIANYSDVILGGFSAHAHVDIYKLFYDESGNAVSAMYIPPSVTPWRVPLADDKKTPPHNPGLRRIYFEEPTHELLDYEQFTLDLDKANEGTVRWRRLFNFVSYYEVPNIKARSLAALLEEFKEYGNEKFNKYYNAAYMNTRNEDYMPCDCECKSSHLCAIEFVDYDEYDSCYAEKMACGEPDGARTINKLEIITLVAMPLAWLIY